MGLTDATINLLVCPVTGQRLTLCPLAEAERVVSGGQPLETRPARKSSSPFGSTPMVLLREDQKCAYPVVDGFPILLGPEMLYSSDEPISFDLASPQYEEAYLEMEFYNDVAIKESQDITASESYEVVQTILRGKRSDRHFPNPSDVWVDSKYGCVSQFEAYQHLAPIAGKRAVQIGGKGIHAVKFLLAGAAEGWLVTPMLGEACCAQALAQKADVADRLHCVVGIAEELPLASDSIDVVFSGGCIHHMRTEIAFPEIKRILRVGGRVGAVEPWRAPFYETGIKIFGKQENNPYCRPLDKGRIAPLFDVFQKSRVSHHGSLTRYPLLALSKLGLELPMPCMRIITNADDAVSTLVPGLRGIGSSVALLGEK